MFQHFVILTILIILKPAISLSKPFRYYHDDSKIVQINVKDFGAVGNGIQDDTRSIQNAIDSSVKVHNSLVIFPNGIYMVSSLDIKSNIQGSKKTTIKNNKLKLDSYLFCNVSKRKNITIKSIIFDGSTKLDKLGKLVRGSIPLFIKQSSDIAIINCSFKNSPMSGLRVEACSDIMVEGCLSNSNRGVYGDGYYFNRTNNLKVANCTADNYTRIGFVTERNSYNIIFSDCHARNGHSSSILSGGIEYNAGFWYENSANIKTIRCLAENNTHRGFVATTGPEIGKFIENRFASFEFTDCKSINNPIGFVFSSMGTTVNTLANRCEAEKANTGFHSTAQAVTDRFSFIDCKVIMNPLSQKSANNVAFNWDFTPN
jgi:polygalacturonase